MATGDIRRYFNQISTKLSFWGKKNRYYHKKLEELCQFIIPPQRKVLEIGVGMGDLLASLSPSYGVGLDIAEKVVKLARKNTGGLGSKFKMHIKSPLMKNLTT